MKKTIKFFAILAVLLFAASCQNTDIDNGQAIDNGSFTVTATIVAPDATRVTYDVDNETTHTITPAWTVGDAIIGFDDADHTFTFTVASVDGSGRATLDANGYVPGAATKLYAIYYPGKTVSDFGGSASDYTLAVDLSSQAGAALNDNSPVLMCATADITAGSATLDFENQAAIIGVTKFKLPAAATVTSVSVDGLITSGTFKLDGGALVLTPGTTPSTITATGSWATGEGNICTTALYFATLPTASAKIALRANDGANDYGNLASIAATDITAGNYYYMQKNLGAPVADVNGVKYGAIEDAFNAANVATSAVTLTLLADCSTSTRFNINASGTGAVTLDLNGHTLNTSQQIRVTGRTLTIKDNSSGVLAEQGKIISTYADGRLIYLNTGASFTLLGGTVNRSCSGNYQTVFAQNSSSMTLSGGKVISNHSAVYCETSSSMNINGNVIIEADSTAVNNNGCTLVIEGSPVITGSLGNSGYAVRSQGTGTTTISGSPSIRGNNAVYCQSGSTVNISGTPTMYSASGATIYVAQGTTTISGGTFRRGGSGLGYVVYTGNASAVINIDGGYYENIEDSGNDSVIYANTSGSVIYVTDGYFKSKGVHPVSHNNGMVYATGGYYNKAVRLANAIDDSDNVYVNVLNTNPLTADTYPFTLSPASVTPTIAITKQSTYTWHHGTVESAFKCADQRAKANGSATVTLQGNASISATLVVNEGNANPVTLELNGHTISSTANPAVSAASNFFLNDLGSGGELATTGAVALSVTAGTSSVNSGSLYGATNAANVSGGTLNVYGGHIYGGGAADIVTTAGTIALSGGFFRYEPEVGWMAVGYASAGATETFNTRSYDYQVEASAVVATVDGENCGSWTATVAAISSYTGAADTVRCVLLEDISGATAASLEHATKPVLLDLNGHTLSSPDSAFIKCQYSLTIVDKGISKGMITSSRPNVICKVGTGKIELQHCTIECTQASAESYSGASVVYVNNSNSTVNIDDCKIYSTGKVTAVSNRSGKLTISNSEITSGKNSAGLVGVYTGGGSTTKTTINNCSIVTTSTTTSRGVFYIGNGADSGNTGDNAGTVTINGGYFYGNNFGRPYASDAQFKKITINGGYSNTQFISSYKSYTPTFGDGKSEQACSVTHTHQTTGETYTYTYKVNTTTP